MKTRNPAKPEIPEHDSGKRPRHVVRLPGFLAAEGIGLGDAIKRVTYSMGIKPCTSCEKRAAALNQWMKISRR
jgi:hypothetical protein